MMVIVWTANVAVVALIIGAAFLIKANGVDFALGVLFATAIYQIVHRITHGAWF